MIESLGGVKKGVIFALRGGAKWGAQGEFALNYVGAAEEGAGPGLEVDLGCLVRLRVQLSKALDLQGPYVIKTPCHTPVKKETRW